MIGNIRFLYNGILWVFFVFIFKRIVTKKGVNMKTITTEELRI